MSSGTCVVGPWHLVGSPLNFGGDDFTFRGHGYYNVYVQYAQWTTSGYVYDGAYETQYGQGTSTGLTVTSNTCYI